MTVGRFAPTPSGPLHLGSLVAALGSFLDAKKRGGAWLVRIEDVDLARCRGEFERSILLELERHGLHWDGEVVRQSARTSLYDLALSVLRSKDLLYPCSCSRMSLKMRGCRETPEGELVYPGICRSPATGRSELFFDKSGAAIRFWIKNGSYEFSDGLAGLCQGSLADEVGDFVLRRADGCFSYHLAVVVDDHLQGVNRVVRGRDILPLTGRHVVLQHALGYQTPQYAHIPLVLGDNGTKLSKSASAQALAVTPAKTNLQNALCHLGVQIDLDDFDHVNDIILFAIENYCLT